MAEQIWLFGDSFVEKWQDPEVNGKPAWPIMLEKKFNVSNFGKSGSGPDFQLDVLYKEIEKHKHNIEDLKNINLIFFISHNSRIDFSFLASEHHQVYAAKLIDGYKQTWKDETPEVQKIMRKYSKHYEFLNNFYRYYYFHQNYEIDFWKRVSLLKDITQLFKKVMVVPIFDDIQEHRLYSMVKNPKNFCIAEGSIGINLHSPNFSDPNHLSEENHYELYALIKRWLKTGKTINLQLLTKYT